MDIRSTETIILHPETEFQGTSDTSEDEVLGVDMFHLPQSDYIRLTKDLHGKMCLLFALSQTDEQNAPECARARAE